MLFARKLSMVTHCVSKIVDQVVNALKMYPSDESIQCDNFYEESDSDISNVQYWHGTGDEKK